MVVGNIFEVRIGHGLGQLEDRQVRLRRTLKRDAGRPVLGFLRRPRTAQGVDSLRQFVASVVGRAAAFARLIVMVFSLSRVCDCGPPWVTTSPRTRTAR